MNKLVNNTPRLEYGALSLDNKNRIIYFRICVYFKVVKDTMTSIYSAQLNIIRGKIEKRNEKKKPKATNCLFLLPIILNNNRITKLD